jgi:2'-5' RNA ligase
MAMYFIAVTAPPAVNEEVLSWKNFMQEQYGCKAALKSPAHITLVPPFNMDVNEQVFLENCMKRFSAQAAPFTVTLKNFSSFAPRVLYVDVVNNHDLEQLKLGLEKHLLSFSSFPIKIDSRPFHPHVTIANRDLGKQDYYKAWEVFQHKQYEATFAVEKISLMLLKGNAWAIAYEAPLKQPGLQ